MQLYSKCDAIKRQSDIVISSVMNDEKLVKTMMEIEKMAKEREDIRLDYMRQVAQGLVLLLRQRCKYLVIKLCLQIMVPARLFKHYFLVTFTSSLLVNND